MIQQNNKYVEIKCIINPCFEFVMNENFEEMYDHANRYIEI